MFLSLLTTLCGVVFASDTIDVATVSSRRNAAAAAVAPVQNMSQTRIRHLGTLNLHEAVRHFSGVTIKDYGGIGGMKTVSVRNMGASHTAVIYDGIAISDAQNGQTDISQFNMDDISGITMSVGMIDDIFTSARHMNSAGVLRLESRMPQIDRGKTSAHARMIVGSFGTYMPYVQLCHKLNHKYAFKASLDGTFSKGDYPFMLYNGKLATMQTRLNSDVHTYGVQADFYADWHTGGMLKAKVNLHNSQRGLPGSVVLYTQNAFERLWDRKVISNVMYDKDFGAQWKVHADAGFTHNYNRHRDADPIYREPRVSIYSQNEYSLAARVQYTPVRRWRLALAEDAFVNTLDSNIPECPFPVRFTSATALSARYGGPSLTLTASVVGVYVRESLRSGDSPADRFRLSPMAGVSWNFYKGMYLRASLKEGFRMPTFNDLYYSRVGNRDLKPEIARQSDVGFVFTGTYAWGTLDFTVDGYYNFIQDKIVAVPTMFIWRMRNVGRVAMYGTDLTISALWKACGWLSVYATGNYSLQYALDVTDPQSKSYRHQIPYTPRHCGSASLTMETSWCVLTYKVNAAGRRYSMNQNIPDNEIAPYVDHGVSVGRDFAFGRKRDYDIYIGVEGLNLSGYNYEIIRYYPMPGRSFRVTVKLKY